MQYDEFDDISYNTNDDQGVTGIKLYCRDINGENENTFEFDEFPAPANRMLLSVKVICAKAKFYFYILKIWFLSNNRFLYGILQD